MRPVTKPLLRLSKMGTAALANNDKITYKCSKQRGKRRRRKRKEKEKRKRKKEKKKKKKGEKKGACIITQWWMRLNEDPRQRCKLAWKCRNCKYNFLSAGFVYLFYKYFYKIKLFCFEFEPLRTQPCCFALLPVMSRKGLLLAGLDCRKHCQVSKLVGL